VIKRIHGNAAGTAFARIITAANVADRTGYVARHGDLGSVLIQLDTVEVFQVTSVTPTVLTPTNAVANHALTHQFGGSDLILAQLLGSLGAAGFVMETDGAGGWTLIPTPGGGGLPPAYGSIGFSPAPGPVAPVPFAIPGGIAPTPVWKDLGGASPMASGIVDGALITYAAPQLLVGVGGAGVYQVNTRVVLVPIAADTHIFGVGISAPPLFIPASPQGLQDILPTPAGATELTLNISTQVVLADGEGVTPVFSKIVGGAPVASSVIAIFMSILRIGP